MKFSEIEVPFVSNDVILKKANKFREKHWNEGVPVDIEHIIEIKLGLDLIPIVDLQKTLGIEALILASWKSIYVDANTFENERYVNRFRFSLAHEIAHYVLHKRIYESYGINSPELYYEFIGEIPERQYGYFEIQAQKFANRLLVPRDRLKIEKEKAISSIPNSDELMGVTDNLLNSYVAIPISEVFGVCQQVIEIALSDL